MTGAGRLSSSLQPVTASTAPLFLSCIVYRRRRRIPLPQQLSSDGVIRLVPLAILNRC